jgi:hypothetical protein
LGENQDTNISELKKQKKTKKQNESIKSHMKKFVKATKGQR